MAKSKAQLDAEIYANSPMGRYFGKRVHRNARLVVLDENRDGQAIGKASAAQLREFVERGTINGDRYDYSIAIQYNDKNDNDVAESLTRDEARAFLP